ncbi:hypothetical protein AB0H49_33500 [Nocardia sp. NPDC050713]
MIGESEVPDEPPAMARATSHCGHPLFAGHQPDHKPPADTALATSGVNGG